MNKTDLGKLIDDASGRYEEVLTFNSFFFILIFRAWVALQPCQLHIYIQ